MTRKKRVIIKNRTQRESANNSFASLSAQVVASALARGVRGFSLRRPDGSSPENVSSRLSSKNIHFLKKSWQSICKYKAATCPPYNPIQDSDIQHIQETGMYPHIPGKIRQIFESSQHRGIKCETELLRGRKVAIYIASSQSINVDIYLNNIVAWLNFISDVASHNCAQTLNVYLLLTDAKKQLPEIDTEPIDQIHANTAFTTSCSSMNDIFVFRQEEWFKVFMHETFHCFGLDFSSSKNDESNSRILSLFPALNPSTDVRLYETFCEMWGEVFHLLFCLFTDKNGKGRPFSEAKFYKALRKEQRFSIYQSNKILRRAGYKYRELFSEPLDNDLRISSSVGDTPAFLRNPTGLRPSGFSSNIHLVLPFGRQSEMGTSS